MKKLSQACEPILTIAEKTNNSLAQSQSSSIKGAGKMIIAPQQFSQKTPRENDKSLSLLLKHTLNLPLNTQRKTIFTEHGTEFVDEVSFGDLTQEQAEQATRLLQDFNKPLPKQEIVKLIARLQIICPEKNKTQIDTAARTAIWVEELSKYPADVVTYALKSRYKWFPMLSEVLDNCDNEMAYRKLVERGIRVAKIY